MNGKTDDIQYGHRPPGVNDIGIKMDLKYRPFRMEIWDGVINVESAGERKPPSRLSLWMAKGIGMVTKFEWK